MSHQIANSDVPNFEPLCPRCKWMIAPAVIDKNDKASKCPRCGFRIGGTVSALKRQRDLANADPSTFQEKLLAETGYPVWLGVLVVSAVAILLFLVFLVFRDRSLLEQEQMADAEHAAALIQYETELQEMLDEFSEINRSSPEFVITEAIDTLTLRLKERPENPDGKTNQKIADVELRLDQIMQLNSGN